MSVSTRVYSILRARPGMMAVTMYVIVKTQELACIDVTTGNILFLYNRIFSKYYDRCAGANIADPNQTTPNT